MRAFYKLCAKLAATLISIGIILTIIGLINGAKTSSLNFAPIHKENRIDIFDMQDSDITPFITTGTVEYMIGAADADIHSIDINIGYGDVLIKEGEAFQIFAGKDSKDYLKSSQKNGTWKIESKKGVSFNMFGISIGDNGLSRNKKDNIIIYIPKDYQAKAINIELGAGKMTVEQLKADRLKLDVGAGTLQLDKLYAYESAEVVVGAGQIHVDTIEANNIEIDCGVGSVEVEEGSLIGNNSIQCGVGNVELRLTGDQEDYNYYVDSGIGNVIINEEKYSLRSSSKRTNDMATNEFDIECGIGNINIQIKE